MIAEAPGQSGRGRVARRRRRRDPNYRPPHFQIGTKGAPLPADGLWALKHVATAVTELAGLQLGILRLPADAQRLQNVLAAPCCQPAQHGFEPRSPQQLFTQVMVFASLVASIELKERAKTNASCFLAVRKRVTTDRKSVV